MAVLYSLESSPIVFRSVSLNRASHSDGLTTIDIESIPFGVSIALVTTGSNVPKLL